jgi:hypothetical protein
VGGNTMIDLQTLVTAALVKPLPCTRCERADGNCPCIVPVAERLEARTKHVIAELTAGGYLTLGGAPEPAEPRSIEDDAKWLADASNHPRLIGIPDGWRDLLETEAQIEFAHHQAKTRAGYASTEVIDKLNDTRDRLIAHVKAQRVTETQA